VTSSDFRTDTTPAQGDGGAADPGTMPLGVDSDFDATEMVEFTSVGRKPKFNSGAVLLVAVIVTALAGLYSMRTLTRATAATTSKGSEIEKSIESFLKLATGGRARDEAQPTNSTASDKTVLEVLSGSYADRQVPLEKVQRNPFLLLEDPTLPRPVTAPKVDARAQLRRDRQALFEQAAGRFRVRSVMMGREPLATVDNRVVRVGDEITAVPENVLFRVTAIETDTVVLVAEDEELDLRVEATLRLRRDR
jgi:hypothetical protein